MLVAWQRPVIIQSLFPLVQGEEPALEEIDEYILRLDDLKQAGARISLVQIYPPPGPSRIPIAGTCR